MRIIGLDASLTATGISTPEQVTTLPPPAKLRGPERLVWIRHAVMAEAESLGLGLPHADLVVIEGYSHASAYQAHQLGELGGVLRTSFWEAGIPFVEVSPGQLKQYATGKGNASKDEVLAAAIRRLNFQGSDHNQADALWLWTMAADRYDQHDLLRSQARQAVLDKIAWPELSWVPA